MEVLIGSITSLNKNKMKVFEYFFYLFFGIMAKYLPGKPDYDYASAIFGGIFFSIFLLLNILTILIILGCGRIIAIVFANLGLAGFFLLLLLPFIFVYFMCIHKKKYLKIQERYNYMEKFLKKRLLAALFGFLYIIGSGFLFALASTIFK